MPEPNYKEMPPKVHATLTCLRPDCGGKKRLDQIEAEKLTIHLARGLPMQQLLRRFRCAKCGHRQAGFSFYLMREERAAQHDPRHWPWIEEGHRRASKTR